MSAIHIVSVAMASSSLMLLMLLKYKEGRLFPQDKHYVPCFLSLLDECSRDGLGCVRRMTLSLSAYELDCWHLQDHLYWVMLCSGNHSFRSFISLLLEFLKCINWRHLGHWAVIYLCCQSHACPGVGKLNGATSLFKSNVSLLRQESSPSSHVSIHQLVFGC